MDCYILIYGIEPQKPSSRHQAAMLRPLLTHSGHSPTDRGGFVALQ
jgi:hypothetical protein